MITINKILYFKTQTVYKIIGINAFSKIHERERETNLNYFCYNLLLLLFLLLTEKPWVFYAH